MMAITVLCIVLGGLPSPAHGLTQVASKTHTIPDAAKVDINRATQDELLKVPGMTRTWAARIVRFRPYRTKADLVERGVVTGQVYYRIKDFVIAHRDKQ
jgi:DNA uptake protein ComE-like DNA-binding protein